jgi:hypothetical protein
MDTVSASGGSPSHAGKLGPVHSPKPIGHLFEDNGIAFPPTPYHPRAPDSHGQTGLRKAQYRSHLIDGCLAETGLTLRPD